VPVVSASEDAFALLEVIPNGDQSLDLVTGETILHDGGLLRDQKSGLELEAIFVRFVEGEILVAEGVTALRQDFSFSAPVLQLDLETSVATVPQGVAFAGSSLDVTATLASLDFAAERARFDAVVAASPAFEARALIVDLVTGDALLLGPYVYEQGFLVLRDPREEGRLLLLAIENEEGVNVYDATTDAPTSALERFGVRE